MMTESWPMVAENDDGIRSEGRCFYCRACVGFPHGMRCVRVKKRVEMRVRAVLSSGIFTGLWQFDEPHYWGREETEFHKNESSWCAGNIVDERDTGTVTWDTGDPWSELASIHDAAGCLCSVLSFEFARVVDDTPRCALKPGSPVK